MIRWAVHKLEGEEWSLLAVMTMYPGTKTVVRTVYGNSNSFEVKVGSADGDADAAVETRIRIGWNKFRQLVTLP